MDVRLVTNEGVEQHPAEALKALLDRGDGIVWVDIPHCDTPALDVLADVFGFHPRAVRDCAERNRVPKVHTYPDHVFVVLHAPERGEGGHVHYVELDQFIGPRYLVTVHGPVNPAVAPAAAVEETAAVLRRVEAGRLRPSTSFELSHAVATTLIRRQEAFVETLTSDVWQLEQRVTGGHLGDPEDLLDELFRTRHGLIAVRTMGTLSRDTYERVAALVPPAIASAKPLAEDIADRFDRVRSLAEAQKEYLQGVIEFYQTRTETKMTIAAERLAVIAAVTLPITALSSILGMNVIVNDATQPLPLALALAVMVTISGLLLRWAKRQGWW